MMTQVNFDSIGGGGATYDSGVIPWTELNGQTEYTVTLGYEPKKIMWNSLGSTYAVIYTYDKDFDSSKFYGTQGTAQISTGTNIGGNTYWNELKSVDANGFTLRKFAQNYAGHGISWVALKE